jgi:hypothetical protein
MVKPVNVTVITYAPTVFRHCQHCEVAFNEVGLGERIHRAEARDALPADLAEEFQRVSDWVHGLIERHGSRLAIDVIDAASIEGVIRSLRHGVRRFPAVIVGSERRIGAFDVDELDRLVDARVGEQEHPPRGVEGAA